MKNVDRGTEPKLEGDDLLAPGYSVRHPKPEDAAEVHTLIAASEFAEFGEPDDYSLEEILDDWDRFDLERDVWVAVAPSGALAGYAYVWPRQHVRIDVEVYVHPDHYGRAIGASMIRRAEARACEEVPLAPPGSRVVVNNWINALNADAVALLAREEYQPVRYFWRMVASLGDEPAPFDWPAGIAVRSAVGDADLRPFYDTVEEGMADHWGHVETPFEVWVARRMGSTFHPELWFLATDSAEPAGAVLCSIAEGVGWVDTLVVRRPYRRRGLGLALLHHAFTELARRGARRVKLAVDAESPTGATRLYERAGMHVAQQHAVYCKVLREGDA